MAQALCGPSNPLQNIQKHASVDRTLQQDRLIPSRSPIQGFRSQPKIPPSQVEAEFEAFQRGEPLFPGQVHEPDLPFHSEPAFVANLPPSWATDFQQLRLNDSRSSPIPSSQFRHEAPMQKSGSGGWHQEFMNQARLAPEISKARASFGPGSSSGYMPRMNGPGFYSGGPQLSSVAQGRPSQRPIEESYEHAAFERAFDAASKEMMEQDSARGGQEQAKSKYELINEQLEREKRQQDAEVNSGKTDGDDVRLNEAAQGSRPIDPSQLSPEARSDYYATRMKFLEQQNLERGQAAEQDSRAKEASEMDQRGVTSALSDYDAILRRLEEENTKRVHLARLEGGHFKDLTYEQYMEEATAGDLTHAEADYQAQRMNLVGYRDHQLPHASERNGQAYRSKDDANDVTSQQSAEEQEQREEDARAADQADELARTAGQLLDNLKDEKSAKFQQSSFMQLMRQLRDKEMKVEGENIVPVSKPP